MPFTYKDNEAQPGRLYHQDIIVANKISMSLFLFLCFFFFFSSLQIFTQNLSKYQFCEKHSSEFFGKSKDERSCIFLSRESTIRADPVNHTLEGQCIFQNWGKTEKKSQRPFSNNQLLFSESMSLIVHHLADSRQR